MLLSNELSSSNKDSHDSDSLTDVSILIETKSNDDQTLKSSQLDKSIDDLFFQSLIDYANSFNSNETVYSIHDLKNQLDSTRSIKQKSSKSTALVRPVSRKSIPSYFFSNKKVDDDDDNSDENTTATDQSKFQWEQSSDTTNHSKGKISLKPSSSPIIVYEKTKDRFLPQHIDIQVVRSPTPIIIREIIPNRSSTKNRLPLISNTFTQHSRSSKPPIIPKSSSNQQSKKIIIEYDQLNIKVDKNIRQRKEIKRVHPNEYVRQYGSSLYSTEVFHHLFTNIIS
jgi:hypothetical protein